MNLTSHSLFISFLLPFLLYLVGCVTSFSFKSDSEKQSPFECGIDPLKSARLPFSLRFFLLALIFVIFDIEIALMMPIPLLMFSGMKLPLLKAFFVFLIILLLGMFHEWREGSLFWSS